MSIRDSIMNTLHRFQDPRREPTPEMRRYAERYMKGIEYPNEQEITEFRQAHFREDPLADQWVHHASSELSRSQREELLSVAIREGVDRVESAPRELKALFDTLEVRPDWLDDQLLALGRETVRRSGPLGNWLLVNVALMGGYRYEGVILSLIHI